MRKLMHFASGLAACLASSSALAVQEAAKAGQKTPDAATTGQTIPTLGGWGFVLVSLALVGIAARFLVTRRQRP